MKRLHHFLLSFSSQEVWALTGIISLFILLRIPSLIEPYWYGDEGIYHVIGDALRHGRTLYSEIWDNKTPLLYILYALLPGDQFYIRLTSLIFGAATIVVYFLLSRKLLSHLSAVVSSTLLFSVLFGLPLLEGNIANAENFMLLPILVSFYLVFSSIKQTSVVQFIISGFLLSLAFLTKTVAVFDAAALGLFILFVSVGYKDKRITVSDFRSSISFSLAFIIPVLLSFLYFLTKGALSDYITAAYFQNVGYVGEENYWLIPQGQLVFKGVIVIASLGLLFYVRRHLRLAELLIGIWFVCSLCSTFFSDRPYIHYVLMSLSVGTLAFGYALDKKRYSLVAGILLLCTAFIVNDHFKLYKKSGAYYRNYIIYLTNNKSEDEYMSFFDGRTPFDYEIAQFVQATTEKDQTVLFLSDSGQLYTLSDKLPPGRYIVAYHMTYYPQAIEETILDIERTNPKYIIKTKEDDRLIPLLNGYTYMYSIGDGMVYEREY